LLLRVRLPGVAGAETSRSADFRGRRNNFAGDVSAGKIALIYIPVAIAVVVIVNAVNPDK